MKDLAAKLTELLDTDASPSLAEISKAKAARVEKERAAAQQFEDWKEAIASQAREMFSKVQEPLTGLLTGFVGNVDKQLGRKGQSTIKDIIRSGEGIVTEKDVERFLFDFMLDFFGAARMERKMAQSIAKEAAKKVAG